MVADFTREPVAADNRCSYCTTARGSQQDHIMPNRVRTPDWADVTVPACPPCNTRKGDRLFVPPSWEDRIPELNEKTFPHKWRVFRGAEIREVVR